MRDGIEEDDNKCTKDDWTQVFWSPDKEIKGKERERESELNKSPPHTQRTHPKPKKKVARVV